ncbi:hypothetical protein L6R52_15405 [Myxococcota bacterium]|nr:hypothetical protein [Myxococcota bacterium]
MTFTVTAATPTLSSVTPASAPSGSASFTLTLSGARFLPQSYVVFRGSALATTYHSRSLLTASVPASLVATPGLAQVTVVTPAPGGGTSRYVNFSISGAAANTGPSLAIDSSLAPYYATRDVVVPEGGTVTIATGNTVQFNRLELRSGATIQPSTCTTSSCWCARINVTGDLVISTGATLNADGRGYLGSYQNGNGYYGMTSGNVYAGASWWSGGSHGGWGGNYSGGPTATYGDLYAPSLPGAGGNAYPGYNGGSGGGCIIVTVGGTLQLDGTITANGAGGGSNYAGGAGGSIWLTADTLASSRTSLTLAANGGNAVYGAGSGGRIALHYNTLSGFDVNATTVQVNGGTGNSSAWNGGPGTIVYGRSATSPGNLLITAPSSRVSSWGPTRIGAFGSITALTATVLTTSAPLVASTLVGKTLRPNINRSETFLITANSASTITITGGDLRTVAAVDDRFYVVDYETQFENVTIGDYATVAAGALSAAQVTFANSTASTIYSVEAPGVLVNDGSTVTADYFTADTYVQSGSTRVTARRIDANDVVVQGTALLRGFEPTTLRFFPLEITANTLRVTSSARISVDGLGYLGSYQNGNGYYGLSVGQAYAGASWWSGGSHGNWGGNYSGGPTAFYGDVYEPVLPGAGGNAYPGYNGGNGGGVLRLDISDSIELDGTLSANGIGGGSNYAGGAGGSIWISTNGAIRRTGTGVFITANGGDAVYGAGSGGRIALYYGSLAGWTPSSATVRAYGGVGNSSAWNGGSGTIFYKPNAAALGTLLVTTTAALNSSQGAGRVGAFGAITALTNTVLTTSDPLVAGTLAGKQLVPDADNPSAPRLAILSNTASTITVAGGLTAATAVGRAFYVADYATAFSDVIVENANYATGFVRATNQVTLRGSTTMNNARIEAPTLLVQDTARLTSRSIAVSSYASRNTAVTTLKNLTATNAEIADTSVLTGWQPTTTTTYPVRVVADDLSVATGALITVDGLGYVGSYQNGNGYYANTIGNVYAGASWWSGGSHGGWGGSYSGGPTMYYGDLYEPRHPGAGGNAYPGYNGGNGGGVLDLVIADTLTIDGVISANGVGGGSNYAGGAGGSILVNAGTIATTRAPTLFRANGGNAVYGAGSGGRIALYYQALSGWAINATSTQVQGGTGNSSAWNGASGTVFHMPPTGTDGTLLLSASSAGNSSWAPNRLGAFGTITAVSSNGLTLTTSDPLPAVSFAGYTLKADYESDRTYTIVSNTASTITVAASMAGVARVGGRFHVVDFETRFDQVTIDNGIRLILGTIDVNGLLEMNGSTVLSINDLHATTFTTVGAPVITMRRMNVGTATLGGTTYLTGYPSTTTTIYPLTLEAGAMSIASGVRVSMDGYGYLGSHQNGNGYYGMTNGNVYTGASWWSGGSHAGRGGSYSGDVAGVFGNALEPTTPGGGGNAYPGYNGGSGGGVIRIITTGALTLNGVVSANSAGTSLYAGGAGGSIWVTAGSLATTSAGAVLQANGTSSVYGSGGGGRIAVYGPRAGFTNASFQVNAGSANSTAWNGQPGSLHLAN